MKWICVSVRMQARRVQFLVAGVWLLLVAAGMAAMARYENTPGPAGSSPLRWRDDAGLPDASGKFTALVFVHPQCPCTRATLDELERLLVREQGKLRATVVVVTPSQKIEAWRHTHITQIAERIPEVAVRMDVDGREARRFGAQTSGFTVLYDGEQRLRFAGGITESRGQAGENLGALAIEEILEQENSANSTTPVFGCELNDPQIDPGARK